MKLSSLSLFLLFFLGLNVAEAQEDFLTTETGLRYKILGRQNDAPQVKLGDLITFHMVVSNHKDSVLNSTYDMGKPIQNALVQEPKHNADLSDIFPYLAKGDSVICLLKSDSLTKYLGRKIEFIPLGTWVKYHFKVLDVKSKQQVEAEKLAAEEKKKSLERAKIEAFLAKDETFKGLSFQETASGLQYHIKHKGSGIKVPKGSKVKVHYTGKLLNGKVFDSSIEEVAKAEGVYTAGRDYSGFVFPVGQGRVIQGWDEGVGMLNIGDEAVFIIPSYLGYGARGAGEAIPPNSILIFEIKVLGLENLKKD